MTTGGFFRSSLGGSQIIQVIGAYLAIAKPVNLYLNFIFDSTVNRMGRFKMRKKSTLVI